MNEDLSSAFNPYAPPQSNLQPGWDAEEPQALRPVPFEDLEAMPGFWKRVGATFELAFTKPMEFFRRVPVTDGLGAPLRFQFLLAIPLGLFAVCMALFMMFVGGFAELQAQAKNGPPAWFFPAMGGVWVILIPLMMVLIYFLGGAILHLLLWAWGGLRNGQELSQTIRATGYFYAFFLLGCCIPCLNNLIVLAAPVPLGMGLARLHGTDTWRGICAAYSPLVLCCLFYAGIIGFVIASGVMK